MSQKNLNLLLLDGEPSGRVKCTVSNWVGIAFKIPRDKVEICKNRDDLKQSGVYFLFGENEVYIGQANSRKSGNGILDRILEHKRNPVKDYWNTAVIFITLNNSLGATEISFLENKFCNLAINANRYKVRNNNAPPFGNITEEKLIELEEFTKYVQIVLEMLGYKVFEPLEKISATKVNVAESLFYLERFLKVWDCTVKAVGKKIERGFLILAGSQLSTDCDEKIYKFRQKAKISDENILLEDFLLNSPTAAASFVAGYKFGNAPSAWKTSNGISLYEILNREI